MGDITKLHVIKLVGENIKGIKAIEIEPDFDNDTVIVSGKNGAGKSTVLELIWLAMSTKAIKKDVIRSGKNNGHIILDLGEYVVERSFSREKGNKLKVVSKDGVKFNSPQTLLNTLFDDLSISPLKFMQMKEKDQREFLLNMLKLQFDTNDLSNDEEIKTLDDLNEYRKIIYEKRRNINRTVKTTEEQLKLLQDVNEVKVISISEIITKRDEVQNNYNKGISIKTQLEQAKIKINNLKKELSETKELYKEYKNELNKYDFDSLEQNINVLNIEIKEADEINNTAHKYEEKKLILKQHNDAISKSEKYNKEIEKIDYIKTNTINNANMPLKGLSIDDECVRLNNVAVADLSASEKWKLACAIMMANDPDLKVITIEDGSLLDDECMQVLKEMANEKGYQIWIEIVSSDPVGVHIVDGEII